MYFSTSDAEHRVIEIINKQRALDILYDVDRHKLGLSSSAKSDGSEENCVLIIYPETRVNNSITYNYEIQTNMNPWLLPLQTLKDFKTYEVISDFELPWCVIPRTNDILRNYKLDEKTAKSYVSFDERCKQRAYDVSFIVFMQKYKQKIGIADMPTVLKVFFAWLNNEDGTKAFQESMKICQIKLHK